MLVSGTGTITGNGFHTTYGTWSFSAQDDRIKRRVFLFWRRVRLSPTAVLRLLCWDWHWRESKASAENLRGQRAEMAFQHLKLGRFPRFDSCAPAHLKLVPSPTRSPLPSQLYLLCRFSQKLHSTSRFAHLCRSRPRGSILIATLATLPSMSLLPSLHSAFPWLAVAWRRRQLSAFHPTTVRKI